MTRQASHRDGVARWIPFQIKAAAVDKRQEAAVVQTLLVSFGTCC